MKRSYACFLILIVFSNCLLHLASAQVEPPELKKPLQQRPEFVQINTRGYAGQAIVWHDHSFIGAEDFEFSVLDTSIATISKVNRRELNTTIEFTPHKIGVTTFVITASNQVGSVSLSRPLYVYESLTPLYNSLRSYGDVKSLRIPVGYSRTIWFKNVGYLRKLEEESGDEQFDPFAAMFKLEDCPTWTQYYKGCPFAQVIARGSNGAYFEVVAMKVGETFFVSDYGNIRVSTYEPNPNLAPPSIRKVIPDVVASVNKSQLLPLHQYFEGEELVYSAHSVPFWNPEGFDIRIVDFDGNKSFRIDAGSEWVWPTEIIIMAKNTSGSISQTFNVTVRGGKDTIDNEGVPSKQTGFLAFSTSATQVTAGDTFTLHLKAEDVIDLAGWQFDIGFDPTVFEVVEVNEGDFLRVDGQNTFFQKGKIDNSIGKIAGLSAARLLGGSVSGAGTLVSVIFFAKARGEGRLVLTNVQLGSASGKIISSDSPEIVIIVEERSTRPVWDVNEDGQVSIVDMILVAQDLGKIALANSRTDVNGDGSVTILDLIIVAQHFGEPTSTAAPSGIIIDSSHISSALIQAWITRAQAENDGSLAFQQGIERLKRFLALLLPERTVLLPNYPNPFNPETWIPYQLAEPADVTLRIYAADGKLIRTLVVGLQPAGIYEPRSRAVYWDGKNALGESVASGVYFYTLTAGDFTATRKMLIQK